MKAFKRRIQLTFFIGLFFIVLIFLNDYWGISNKEGNGTQSLNNTTERIQSEDSLVQSTPTEEVLDTIQEEVNQVDTLLVEIEPNDSSLLMEDPVAADTSVLDTVITPSIKEIEFNLIEVKRRGKEVYYVINGEETDNLVEGLTRLEVEKNTILKINGNITYAEGQDVKTILEVKEIKYSETN